MTSEEFQDELSILINMAMKNKLSPIDIAGALILGCCAFGVGYIQQEISKDDGEEI